MGTSHEQQQLQPKAADEKDINSTPITQHTQIQQKPNGAACERQQSSISSISSLTNSSTSPSSSLTSISTNSPTSTSVSNSHSTRSVSISSNSEATCPLAGTQSASTCIMPAREPQASEVNLKQLSESVSDEPATFLEQSSVSFHQDSQQCNAKSVELVSSHRDTHLGSHEELRRDSSNELAGDDGSEAGGGASVEPTAGFVVVAESARLEKQQRSNSCSQADADAAQFAAGEASAHSAGLGASSSSLASASHRAIPTIVGAGFETSSTDQLCKKRDLSTDIDTVECSSARTNAQPGASANTSSRLLSNQSSASSSFASTSSRFFTSKLNTGSLWSLLSVGSNSSANASDTTVTDNPEQLMSGNQSDNDKNDGSRGKQQQQHQQQQQQQDNSNKQIGNIFSRVHSFRLTNNMLQAQHSNPVKTLSETHTQSGNTNLANQESSSLSSSSSSSDNTMATARATDQASSERKRFRFSVRYFGSSMLHKNFTLPMLEWIAKDIRRQTVRGAQSISQRQITIPARDIILEIQSYQLKASSNRDGHCVFVHPMHCVSKYAQLQHDPTSFAYLIRDTKDSPTFCHVFQAKSANKVHDIFSAVREVTTRTQMCHPTLPPTPTAANASLVPPAPSETTATSQQSVSKSVQKSASLDLKGMFGGHSDSIAASSSATNPKAIRQTAVVRPMVGPQQLQTHQHQANNQFENSYQFEVMFVKKVKLQYRRVPTTFVDDALETLKSFEVLKGGDSKAQIKGVGKRIISASVDERQEYDEACQSPTPGQKSDQAPNFTPAQTLSESPSGAEGQRRGSSVSLHKSDQTIKEERESRSCQHSPTKVGDSAMQENRTGNSLRQDKDGAEMKKHQSVDCLTSLSYKYDGEVPTYSNDFSPYNTITSADLNERIAAIPVVSSSVSLDHETRQKLARQVRETIMATAANIKKGVYASGDKLNCSASSKALDSLSCTVASYIPALDHDEPDYNDVDSGTHHELSRKHTEMSSSSSSSSHETNSNPDHRRSSASPAWQQQSSSNNFDLFRRASARQVVKNRTMLLLIGKDELCTISIDKHQMLFSKSFSSIVHCLQGNNMKDHFGLICRDSGKINPNAESYAGFIFKCQSEKVVREIMGALKQVIYSSQHNYHGYSSPYNPLNTIAPNQGKPHQSPKLERIRQQQQQSAGQQLLATTSGQLVSLAAKRGFANPIEIDDVSRHTTHSSETSTAPITGILYQRTNPAPSNSASSTTMAPSQPKNLIKSMFCDNCPLYWYHRLCCDIESLPAEASKAIILRRIDSSMTEKEQDELYSKFSEFNIESISEHNEIFMSLLRHLCEKKQFKHAQSNQHLSAMIKNSAQAKQQSLSANNSDSSTSSQGGNLLAKAAQLGSLSVARASGHQRSGSSSASLAFVIGQANANANQAGQSIADASSAAIDNFKKAKNSISSSIENMLKRRSSMRDETLDEPYQPTGNLPTRTGSFKATSRDFRAIEQNQERSEQVGGGYLKRSQSTSEYSGSSSNVAIPSWKESLSRTINDDLTNPLVGLFRRRNSGHGEIDPSSHTDSVVKVDTHQQNEGEVSARQQSSPNLPDSTRFTYPSQQVAGPAESSSMLSSGFWRKSIFDKIRQPVVKGTNETHQEVDQNRITEPSTASGDANVPRRRTKEELRSLWKKAIIQQLLLIKMDKQNQRLMATNVECDIQRIKLNYRDVPYCKDVIGLWDKLLRQDPTKRVEFSEVARLVRGGVPKQRRGEIWMFLMNQYHLRHDFQTADTDFHGDANQTYRDLLTQLSTQQHEIFVDIGRTFPSHPYYSQYLSIGQLSLFNLLKAYSILDPEVGYCQGLSFVAGILLLHVDTEDEAFELMRHVLFNFGLRKQYLPSMSALHLQLYQLTRLLRDHEHDLFNHFDHYDISPSLYAAPWFLTLFASQFPLGFVARLLDFISLIGIEAIFRVSLNLLAYHKATILACKSLESTMEFMRSDLAKIDDKNLVKIFDKSMSLDLRNKLIEYELTFTLEHTFYCAEERAKLSSNTSKNSQSMEASGTKDTAESNADGSEDKNEKGECNVESTSRVADATATVIIQHLLANNHLRSIRSDYSY